MDLIGSNYKERCDSQLKEWVKGKSIHNEKEDECCPDFSCCKPNLLQPIEVRTTFEAVCKAADDEGYNEYNHPHYDTKISMLMGFLGGVAGDKAHITGGDIDYKSN